MIKTLRITGFVTAILAGICLIFLVVLSAWGDKRIEDLSKIPGVIEEFTKVRGSKTKVNQSQVSPLVVQAQMFARYLNPPQKPKPRKSVDINVVVPLEPKTAVSAKFRVVLTSYSEENPQMSRALIDEPGKGLRWVMQSSMVGHLQIEQIKDGVVVAQGGQETFEVSVEAAAPGMSLVEGSAPVSTGTSSPSGSRRPLPTPVGRTLPPIPVSGSRITPPRTPGRPTQPRMSDSEAAEMGTLMERLKGMRSSSKTDKGGSGSDSAEGDELLEFIKTLARGSRISDEESKKLGDLGKELKDQDPNRAKSGGSKKIESRPPSPNKRSSR